MPKPPEITGLCEDSQCVDWPYTGDAAKKLVIVVAAKQLDRAGFNLIALCNQTTSFGKHQTEHADRIAVRFDG